MKKVFAILLAAALVATLSVVAFAELPADDTKQLSVDFDAQDKSTVYSVDVVWDTDLTFDYNAGAEGTWNPDTHAYDGAVAADWDRDTVNVTVTNHSNAAISAKIDVVDANEEDAVEFAGTAATTIATAVGTQVGAAPSEVLTITVSGTATGAIEEAVAATLKITAAA